MRKKIAVSLCVFFAAALVWTAFQLRPGTGEAGEYYQAKIYIDAQPAGQKSGVSFLQKDGQLYISSKDAQDLFSIRVSANAQKSVKVSSDAGNFMLTADNGAGSLEKEGIVYLPFRKVAEKLNYHVMWENGYLSLVSDPLAAGFSFSGIRFGSSEKKMIEYFGQPDRKDTFSSGVVRYLYAMDSKDFFMADVKDGVVCAIYSNSGGWTNKDLPYGTERSQAEQVLKEKYSVDISKADQNEVGIGNVYLMFDQIDGNRLTAVCAGTPLMMDDMDPAQDYPVLEQEMLDILNAERRCRGLAPLAADKTVAACAKAHSADMGERNYFDHSNPDGEDIGDRMKKQEIPFVMAGENIAAGYMNIIFAHSQLLNSPEHRENLLGDFQYAGIGIAENVDSKYRYYYTQNFYTPQANL